MLHTKSLARMMEVLGKEHDHTVKTLDTRLSSPNRRSRTKPRILRPKSLSGLHRKPREIRHYQKSPNVFFPGKKSKPTYAHFDPINAMTITPMNKLSARRRPTSPTSPLSLAGKGMVRQQYSRCHSRRPQSRSVLSRSSPDILKRTGSPKSNFKRYRPIWFHNKVAKNKW
mmetsp:Transcript_37372/g.60010  ORF Transcript_37372/g.60010 Transcript_37372/m.60010 type:complete len:170 (+) Transcript_37372:120-629(+)